MTPLLSVRGLKFDYRSPAGPVRALNGISFDLEPGQALGLVGESGCGKTTVARAILRLLPANAAIAEGEVLLRGRNLVTMSPEDLRAVRWRDIALVTQSAMNALDPVFRVRSQIVPWLFSAWAALRTTLSTDCINCSGSALNSGRLGS